MAGGDRCGDQLRVFEMRSSSVSVGHRIKGTSLFGVQPFPLPLFLWCLIQLVLCFWRR